MKDGLKKYPRQLVTSRASAGLSLLALMLVVVSAIPAVNQELARASLWYAAAATLLTALLLPVRNIRLFLILCGLSAGGFPLFVLLHNGFYALGVGAGNIPVLHQALEFLHAAFFVLAVIVCPAGFVVGALGALVSFINQRRGKEKSGNGQ